MAAEEKLRCDPGEEKAQAIGQVLLHQPALAGALLVHQDKLRSRMVLLVINLPLVHQCGGGGGLRHAASQ